MLRENPFTGDLEYVADDLSVYNIFTGEHNYSSEADDFDEDYEEDFTSYSAFIDDDDTEDDEFC